ncbi:hypothetical protein [Deinococcus xinjiangensis]
MLLGAVMLLVDLARYVFAIALLIASLVVGAVAGVVMLFGFIVASLFGASVGMAFAQRGDQGTGSTPDLWR